ncbi:carbohydrate ABC transporter permease [Pseudobacteriovorax antillogorgiicola]|uniref:Arabinogalactan oligomer / maltooligosaccharide transport system permease protein n=1 Tax=Pseudobacteriovorax antillogorgiicola TaxID=1513793 RepID=A0A1Y6BGW0_9BACT|nr:sugar ABC transporter permease [Pseudobacteriovorax antillogorgiicola]TCS55571.1 arabinogalactan oligomer/maltooligosaccharide transport system permease protein [Pseudobacteriovorax antillogorgiicola]SMF10761.1 arabinogalactan oligomer / maltooligosaccharide transport system permease protein [Pseudobacteriovorax antillogorgiicola]
MSVSVLPALSELLFLLAILFGIVALGISYLWLNFRVWHYPMYLPFKILIGLSLGGFIYASGGSGLTSSFFASIPMFIGLYYKMGLKGEYRSPLYFMAPALFGIIFLFLYPLVYEFYLSFTDLSLKTFADWIQTGSVPFAGIQNYIDVFKDRATGQSFVFVLWRTMVWTFVNLFFHLSIGLALALLLNAKGLKGVGVYRTILTLPWVIPQVIAVLVWRADFNESVGFINQFIKVMNQLVSFEWNGSIIAPLTWFGFEPQAWFLDEDALFAAACIVNIWLGIPFMMINCLGALQSIPGSVYEASSIDGASWLQKFRHITLPLLKPVMVPAAMLGAIWTFNNLNVIYLMTDQGRYEGADILVTDLFKQSFTYYRYGFAAAYSFVIFAILCVLTVIQVKVSRSNEAKAA